MRRNNTLEWDLHLQPDFLWIDKPSGLNTHSSEKNSDGLVELISASRGENLWVVHRLDQGTSGVLIFARSKEAATRFGKLFENHEIRKTYLFVTATRTSPSKNFETRSHIRKQGSVFVSDHDAAANSITQFQWKASLPWGDLWEARPLTGKPHQIRLHAQDAGIPILGDLDHGGQRFFRLALHSWRSEFHYDGGDWTLEAPLPDWARENPLWTLPLLESIRDRERIFKFSSAPTACLRLAHTEADPFRIDKYGSQWWVSLFREAPPSDEEWKWLCQLADLHGVGLRLRLRQDRGRDPHRKDEWTHGPVADRWEAEENDARFELRAESGQSAGLFLDQRENRAWVRMTSKDRRVLNLFSYTGAFSVFAALGGAREVCTVDVSRPFLDWARVNFELNGLNPSESRFEFWPQDVVLFSKGAAKRSRQWDLIVCDPPSFGRSREGVFQITKHLPGLVESLIKCLAPGGDLLLSCNYEGWSVSDLEDLMQSVRQQLGIPLTVTRGPRAGLDFEKPSDPRPVLKTILVHRQ